MVDFKRMHISLFLIAVLQFPAAAEGLPSSSFTVRAGQEVTLPCENVTDDQQNCDSTTWIFSNSTQRAVVELITLGQVGEHDKSKSDRLSVTQNCSLVIKKVTDEDAGRYDCQQWKSGQRQEPDSQSVVHLSVVTMTEHRMVTLSCSVSPYDGRCPHTVKWLYVGNNVDKDHKALQTLQSVCSASVTFQSSHFIYKSNSDLLKCEVTGGNKMQLFPFRLQPSGEKQGDATTTTTTTATTTTAATTTAATTTAATTAATTPEARADCSVLDFIMLVLRVAELLLITVITVLLIRARGNQRPPEGNTVSYSARCVMRSGAADSQVNNDEDDGVVTYEN